MWYYGLKFSFLGQKYSLINKQVEFSLVKSTRYRDMQTKALNRERELVSDCQMEDYPTDALCL